MFTLLIDTSTHQDNSQTPQQIDWSKPALHGVQGVINRAVFVASKDDDFDRNWSEQRGRYARGAYGFWGYWEGCLPAADQARALVQILKADPGELPVVWLDVEKASSSYPPLPPRSAALPQIERYIATVEDGLGRACGLYTNLAGLAGLAPIPDWLLARPLWIAWPLTPSTGETPEQYIARTGVRPPVQKYWACDWTLWQYSWKGPGLAMGMESHGLDMDYFNGSENDFRAWCGASLPEPEPEDNMYQTYAIGLATDNPAWTNPDFDFVLAEAVESWNTPNPQLKAIEERCASLRIPMLARVRFNLDYYVRNQYPMDPAKWPPPDRDEPLQMAIRALINRQVYGVVVDISDPADHDGRPQSGAWISFAAKIFVERLAGWLKVRKPTCLLYIGTSNGFIGTHAPNLNHWVHAYPSCILEDADSPLDESFPQAGDKPGHLSVRPTWELWQYRPALVLAAGTPAAFYQSIGFTGGATPPPPPAGDDDPPALPPEYLDRLRALEDAQAGLDARLAALELLRDHLAAVFK